MQMDSSFRTSAISRLTPSLCAIILVGSLCLSSCRQENEGKQTAPKLPHWERPYYESGGGTPSLFYDVWVKTAGIPKLSGAKYRCAGIPEGVEIARYNITDHADVLNGFRQGVIWDRVSREKPELAKRISQAEHLVRIRGSPKNSRDLNYHRDVVGFITYLCDLGAVCVFDAYRITHWSPDEWRTRIFEQNGPAPSEHVFIFFSPEHDGTGNNWFHTRGMLKYGRPDLSLHDVPTQYSDAVIELFNRFIRLQALGAIIPEGKEIRMGDLPPGMTCHHGGSMEDVDFNNVHVEIRWPRSAD